MFNGKLFKIKYVQISRVMQIFTYSHMLRPYKNSKSADKFLMLQFSQSQDRESLMCDEEYWK